MKSRVQLVNAKPTYLTVLAEKTARREIFAKPPLQCDYEFVWSISSALRTGPPPQDEGRLKFLYRKYAPRRFKILAHNLRNLFTKVEIVDEDMGKINTAHFNKLDI